MSKVPKQGIVDVTNLAHARLAESLVRGLIIMDTEARVIQQGAALEIAALAQVLEQRVEEAPDAQGDGA